MRAAKDVVNPHELTLDHLEFAPDALAVLMRIARALERLASHGRQPDLPPLSPPASELLGLEALALHLGVSKRWVQRHVRPTFRSSPRGRSWYRISDVEEQIRAADLTAPISRRGSSEGVDEPRIRYPNRRAVVSSSAEVQDVERELRSKLATPPRRTP